MSILRFTGRSAIALLLIAGASFVLAAAPAVKTQPGYYRMMLGDIEVTALSDGTVDLEVGGLLTNTTASRVAKALSRHYLKNPVETSVNAYLINTGSRLVMIDAGAGSYFGPTLGNLVASLKSAGYEPGQIDEIYLTHMHGDHVGGIVKDGKPIFPNAVIRADQREADHWLSQKNLDAAADEAKPAFQGAMAALQPYQSAGRFRPFDRDMVLVPGVRAVATRGHTPGHAVYVVESQGQKLVLWGDLMHVAAVQFPDPSVTIRFDTDPKAAAVQRKKAFADAAKQGLWVGAAHLPFPGLGKLRADGKGYDWIPANYSVPR
jgi:glyoxylase-like metal-dependent hydrolase (beta-lactamase superfamily II)